MAGDGADIPEGAIYTGLDSSMTEGMSSEELKEQDRYLPIANVARIMKKAIPEGGKISKEAKECCQECVSEFISFITSEASDRCSQEKRKTINGEDILYAMSILGFDNYVAPLKVYLQKYREMSKDRAAPGTAELENMSNPMFSVSDGNLQAGVIYAQPQQVQTAYIATLESE